MAREIFAEFAGTFTLVFAITAAIAGSLSFTGSFGPINMVIVSITAGLTLAALVYALGPVSGGHFNPAVTIALAAVKKFDLEKVPGYLIAQFGGALIASAVLLLLVSKSGFAGQTTVGSFGLLPGLAMETIASAVFVIVILSVTSKKNTSGHAGLAIGFYLLAAHLFAIPFSGASLNPARSFGPAVIGGGLAFAQLWIYFAGPIIGGLVGALIYRKALE